MRALEDAVAGLAASSGTGAIHTLLGSGDHIIVQKHLYGGTFALLRDLSARYGVDVTSIDGRDAAEVTEAPRSERRLISELMEEPGAQSRFHLGRRAVENGYI